MEKIPYKTIVECDVKDLMTHQINQTRKGDYFKRLDIVIRYMVVENFFEKNDVGIDLYMKMYKKLFSRRSEKAILRRLEGFKKMTLDAERGEFNTKRYPIALTSRFNIWDGSHRLACAIYFKYKTVFVLKIGKGFKGGCDLGVNRFKRTFTDDEWSLINKKKDEIFKRLKM